MTGAKCDDLPGDRHPPATHLSLVAGPLRLLDGDFPDRGPMRAIAEYSLGQALTLVRSAQLRVPSSVSAGGCVARAEEPSGAMNSYLAVAAVLVLTAGAVLGIAAITTGWLLPGPGRTKVFRPRLWGYGTLMAEAGIGTFLFVGPLHGPDIGNTPYAGIGMAVFFVGLYVQCRAQRPGRTP